MVLPSPTSSASSTRGERNIDVDRRQAGRGRRCDRHFGRGRRRAPVVGRGRLDLDPALRPAPLAGGRRSPVPGGLVALENPVVLAKQPFAARPAAGKVHQGVEPVGEPMRFEQGTRRSELVLSRERQGAQQVVGADREVTLGEPLQKNLRPLGTAVEQRGGGGEQQDGAVARVCAHGRFGLRQEPRLAIGICEVGEDFVSAARLFRLIAERQVWLRRGSTRHAKSMVSRLGPSRRIGADSVGRGYRGTLGDQAGRRGPAIPACGQLRLTRSPPRSPRARRASRSASSPPRARRG